MLLSEYDESDVQDAIDKMWKMRRRTERFAEYAACEYLKSAPEVGGTGEEDKSRDGFETT